MPSPDAPQKRVAHFTSRLELGEEYTTVYSQENDVTTYEAYTRAQKSTDERLIGSMVIEKHDQGIEIVSSVLPEKRPEDPLAAKRALTLLAFSMLQEQREPEEGRRLFIDPAEVQSSDDAFRQALGIRRLRRTGLLTGGREVSVTAASRSIEQARAAVQSALRNVQSYVSPFPGEDAEPRASA